MRVKLNPIVAFIEIHESDHCEDNSEYEVHCNLNAPIKNIESNMNYTFHIDKKTFSHKTSKDGLTYIKFIRLCRKNDIFENISHLQIDGNDIKLVKVSRNKLEQYFNSI